MENAASDTTEAEIQALFDSMLESGYIKRLDIDLFHDAIMIEFSQRLSNLVVDWHIVRFDGVRTVYYRGGILDWAWPMEEHEPEEWEIEGDVVGTIEWSLAGFRRRGNRTLRVQGWPEIRTDKLAATTNFSLEIMGGNGALLIEASRVTIDGKVFDVGYPDAGASSVEQPERPQSATE